MAIRSLLSISLVVSFAFSAFAQGDRLLIDHIDIKRYEKEGAVRFYVDILNRENKAVAGQESAKLTFLLNDDPIDADLIENVEVRHFDEVGEPLAVGILFTNYNGFTSRSQGEASLFRFAR